MRMDHALAMARRLMADHELHGWTVVADRAKTGPASAGSASGRSGSPVR